MSTTIRGSDVAQWSPDDVSNWLTDHLELPKHADIFQKWGVDGPTLLQITTSDLENQFADHAGGDDFKNFIATKKIMGHINIFRIQLSQDVTQAEISDPPPPPPSKNTSLNSNSSLNPKPASSRQFDTPNTTSETSTVTFKSNYTVVTDNNNNIAHSGDPGAHNLDTNSNGNNSNTNQKNKRYYGTGGTGASGGGSNSNCVNRVSTPSPTKMPNFMMSPKGTQVSTRVLKSPEIDKASRVMSPEHVEHSRLLTANRLNIPQRQDSYQTNSSNPSSIGFGLHKSQKGTFTRAPRRVTECLYTRGSASPGVCAYDVNVRDSNRTRGGVISRASRWGEKNNNSGAVGVGPGQVGTFRFNTRPPPGPMSYSPRYEMASKKGLR